MSTPRGNYVVNSKGEILVGKPNFVYGTVEGYFSPQWKLYGLSERWNSRPILFEQLREKMDRGETVEGYVHDIDHGTRRFWGGGKRLPKAKMYLDRSLKANPPMYAHHLRERKTHGLNLKQMRRLYVMVSRGSQKAITFARNVLGIPFDETPSQVKAVVKHHVLDLAEKKVRRNPATGQQKYAIYDVITGEEGDMGIARSQLTLAEAKKLVSRIEDFGENAYIVYHPRDRKGNILVRPSSLLRGSPVYKTLMDMYHGKIRSNPMEYDVLRDKFEVMGGPITDRMQVLLRKIYNMRDAGKSRASMEPLIREYKRLQSIVAPLKSNRRRRK